MVPVLVRALRRNRTNRRYMFHIRNWLTQLWVSQVHSNTLAWKMSWTEEPVRLQSMGSLRVRHNWVISLSLFTCMHWRRKWQPTPVFLPGKSHGWRSLLGYSPWGRKELDMIEGLHFAILWNSAFRCLYLSFSPLLFASLLFRAICKASPDSHFSFLHFFSTGIVLIPVSVQCHEPQSIVHQTLYLSDLDH